MQPKKDGTTYHPLPHPKNKVSMSEISMQSLSTQSKYGSNEILFVVAARDATMNVE